MDSLYHEGDLVVISELALTGTIITHLIENKLLVLLADGIIWICDRHEVYRPTSIEQATQQLSPVSIEKRFKSKKKRSPKS